jgi:hypothetical protein
MRRFPLVTALVAGAVLLGTVALPAPAIAGSVVLPSLPRTGSSMGPTLTIASQRYPAGARFVTATVRAVRAPASQAKQLMLAIVLTCGNESIEAGTNIMTAGSLVARRIMRNPQLCTVRATSALGKRPVDALLVTTTFSSSLVSWGAVGYTPDYWPTLLYPGEAYQTDPVTATVPNGVTWVKVQGDVKVTTCISVSGSRENYSDNLCAADRLDPAGTMLTVALVAWQLDRRDRPCRQVTLSSRYVHADRWTHHVMIPQAGTLTLTNGGGCTSRVRAALYVQVHSGADLVVSQRSTITSIYR